MPGRTTFYKGIQMRSRLEGRFAGWLDRHGFGWDYEGDVYADATGDYLPDFVLRALPARLGVDHLDAGCPTARGFVEVKDPSVDAIDVIPDIERVWATAPTDHLFIVHMPWSIPPLLGQPRLAAVGTSGRWESGRFATCGACGRMSIYRARRVAECYRCHYRDFDWQYDQACPSCDRTEIEWTVFTHPCHWCGAPAPS